MTDHVTINSAEGVLTLTLARPDKMNALTNAMYATLADALTGAEADPAVRAIVMRGEGPMFTAGNDLAEFAAVATGKAAGESHVVRFLRALAGSTKPLVAAVNGRAVGVGTTMLLHCDFVVLAEDALLSTPFVNLALVPEAAFELAPPGPYWPRSRIRDVRLGQASCRGASAGLGHRQSCGAGGGPASRGPSSCRSSRQAGGWVAEDDEDADATSASRRSSDGIGERAVRPAAAQP